LPDNIEEAYKNALGAQEANTELCAALNNSFAALIADDAAESIDEKIAALDAEFAKFAETNNCSADALAKTQYENIKTCGQANQDLKTAIFSATPDLKKAQELKENKIPLISNPKCEIDEDTLSAYQKAIAENCTGLTSQLSSAMTNNDAVLADTYFENIQQEYPSCMTDALAAKYGTFAKCSAKTETLEELMSSNESADDVQTAFDSLKEDGCKVPLALQSKTKKYIANAQKTAPPEPTPTPEPTPEPTPVIAPAPTPTPTQVITYQANTTASQLQKPAAKKPTAAKRVKKTAETGPEALIYLIFAAASGAASYGAARFARRKNKK